MSDKIYVLSMWVDRAPFAAFTAKRAMEAYAKRHGLYDRVVRVTVLPRAGRAGSIREYQLGATP